MRPRYAAARSAEMYGASVVEGRRAVVVLVLVAAVAAVVYVGFDRGEGDKPAGSAAPTHGCGHARDRPEGDLRAAERATLCLLNAERGAKGLRPLRPDPRLRVAALRQSRDMVRRHFFEHMNPDGLDHHDRILRAGYQLGTGAFATGENLGTGQRGASTPAAIVDGWMHSRGHRANILRSEFQEIGIGIVPRAEQGGPGGTYTTTFAGRG
jgi:uncharacterized protein YkwD